MKRFLLYCLLMGCVSTVMAQGVIKGIVSEKSSNEPLQYVTVKVLNLPDSTYVNGAITDVDGTYSISGLKNGNYVVVVSYMGYKDVKRNAVISDAANTATVPQIYLAATSHMLKGVTVTAMKSTMKLEVDRKSYDVSQLITNSGDAASDVLANIPSIQVDNDGNVSLRGNSNVIIWINGKASGLTSDNEAEVLQQIPAESIDHIEVIDNPSSKYSAEGSAGIINIVLKTDLKPGYYGSLQVGGNTLGAANTSFNINYNSKKWDLYLTVGYRHRAGKGKTASDQDFLNTNKYQNSVGNNVQSGNNIFTRAGATYHATKKDDLTLSGMFMKGARNTWSNTLYDYGQTNPLLDSYNMMRKAKAAFDLRMFYGEFDYKHTFSKTQNIDFTLDYNNFKVNNNNVYQDSTTYISPQKPTTYDYQYRPMTMNNHQWEAKVDYENQITKDFKLQAGYQGNFSHQNTPQDYFIDNNNWDGSNQVEYPAYYNRFLYSQNINALYTQMAYDLGNLKLMGGLRGEFWNVNTSTFDYDQDHGLAPAPTPFKKNYFQLFPSFFITYNITKNDELQFNYTRRLKRPWGMQLNSFKNTSNASLITQGNPELTPEYSSSFTLNYLKTWLQHSLMLSAYYRPTSNVMQSIVYQNSADGLMYSTPENVAKSTSSGFELVLKDHLFSILDLTTTADAYNYKINAFTYNIGGQTVTGAATQTFTWTASMMASVMLPYGISFQATSRYFGKQAIAQGYNKANYSIDLGLRKTFLNKKLILSINCRDITNSKETRSYTNSNTFTLYQMSKRNDRNVQATLTWNFGSAGSAKKKPKQNQDQQDNTDDTQGDTSGY